MTKPKTFRGKSPSGKKDVEACRNWLKGKCDRDNCDFWHAPDCRRYKKDGKCKFGDKCGYRHAGKKATPANSDVSSGGDSEKKSKKKQKHKKKKEEAKKKKKKKDSSSGSSANSAVESSDSDEPESAHTSHIAGHLQERWRPSQKS